MPEPDCLRFAANDTKAKIKTVKNRRKNLRAVRSNVYND
jgi:hypothetical protein